MRIAIAATLFASLLAANAQADDLGVDAPFDWAGAYLGVHGGYASGQSMGRGVYLLLPGNDVYGDLDPNGILGGIYAGYNFQFDNQFVVGIEGDINYARIKGDTVLSYQGDPLPPNEMSSEMNWNGSVRARAGYAIDRFLPYVTGGVAFGEYKLTPDYALTGPLSDSTVHTGLTIGAGVDYAITDHLITRLEYRYTDFGSAHYRIPGFRGFFESRTKLELQDIKFGLSYKF